MAENHERELFGQSRDIDRRLRLLPAVFTVIIFSLSTSTSFARECYDDWIKKVSGSGEIIQMASGQIFEVDHYDTFDTRYWLPTESVLICETSGTVKGQVVSVYDIINMDASEGARVWAHKLK